MQINIETFTQRRKAKRLSLNAVATKAGISSRTVAKIKHGADMHRSTVEKLARALDLKVEDLCAALTEQKTKHYRGPDMQVQLAAIKYNVAPEVIYDLAPILFVAIAQLGLERRKARLDTWRSKAEELQAVQPKFTLGSMAEMDAEGGLTHLNDAYWEEIEEIEKCQLDGWADQTSDHFFEALNSVYNGYEFDGYLPEGKSSSPINSLEAVEGGFLFDENFHDTIRELSGEADLVYDPLGQGIAFPHPISEMASENLYKGNIDLTTLPVDLRKRKNAFKRAIWIASRGGQDEIPTVFLHWEAVTRITEAQSYKKEADNLRQQISEAADQDHLNTQLAEAIMQQEAWETLVEDDDLAWYVEWQACRQKHEELKKNEFLLGEDL